MHFLKPIPVLITNAVTRRGWRAGWGCIQCKKCQKQFEHGRGRGQQKFQTQFQCLHYIKTKWWGAPPPVIPLSSDAYALCVKMTYLSNIRSPLRSLLPLLKHFSSGSRGVKHFFYVLFFEGGGVCALLYYKGEGEGV